MMLGTAVLFVVAAVVSALAGWSELAIGAAGLGQIFFLLFLVAGMSEPLNRPAHHRDHARLLPIR